MMASQSRFTTPETDIPSEEDGSFDPVLEEQKAILAEIQRQNQQRQQHQGLGLDAPATSTAGTGEVEAIASGERTVATLSSPWQFDVLQPNCSGCNSGFNPINRRHHCRLCGKIYCNDCTDRRALIPPSSIVLAPVGGKKAAPRSSQQQNIASFSPDQDPDRMLTYISSDEHKELLYGRGLEERFKLAREPLRVCRGCFDQLAPLQADLRASNSNAVRFNHIDPTDARRLFNSPLAFTLGHEIRKAAYTLNNLLPMPKRMGAFVPQTAPTMSSSNDPFDVSGGRGDELQQCKDTCSTLSPTLNNLDGVRIPARLLEQAKGVAVMTVVKGGFGLAGIEFGTGLVVARLDENRWSAPSAIGTAGISWGALVGAQVSDHVFLLMNDSAVEMLFSDQGTVTLGADVGIAVGPLGRAAEASVGASPGGAGGGHHRPATTAPIYTYSLSKGFYAGISLDGKVIMTRPKVNEKFYGAAVTASEILRGHVPTPPAAQPLYEALTRCHFYATQGSTGVGPGGAAGHAQQRRQIMPSVPFPPMSPMAGAPFHQPQYQMQDPDMGEYGETTMTGNMANDFDGSMITTSLNSQSQPPPPPSNPPPTSTDDTTTTSLSALSSLPQIPQTPLQQQQLQQQQQHPNFGGAMMPLPNQYGGHGPLPPIPPPTPGERSISGMSDITTEPGY